HLVGLGRFHHDVAGQVGDLAARLARAEVLGLDRLVERHLRAVDGLDRPLFGEDLAVALAGTARARLALVALRRGEDHAVARLPARDGLGEGNVRVAGLRGRAEPVTGWKAG